MDLFYINCKNFTGKNIKEKQHNAGRYILDYAAKKFYNIDNSEIEIINKKPKFKFSKTEFSISHSHEYAVVCFDISPVGCDIEKIRPRKFEAITKRMHLKTEENSLEAFYKTWTLYEAEIKLQSNVQAYKSFKFKDEYILSVVSSENKQIKFNYFLEIT